MPHTVSTLLRLRPSTGPRQQERANQPAAASRSVMVREAMVAISPPRFAVPRVIPRIIVLGIELRRSFEPLDRVRINTGGSARRPWYGFPATRWPYFPGQHKPEQIHSCIRVSVQCDIAAKCAFRRAEVLQMHERFCLIDASVGRPRSGDLEPWRTNPL